MGRREGFTVLSGDDELTLPILALGGDGLISVVSNVDALPHDTGLAWSSLLSAQLSSPVRWKHCLLQLDELAAMLDAPVIKGETPVKERQRLFEAFRTGEIRLLVVSKVANFSIDLPSAEVAIQVSGSFGSRQEEAQRLGRLLRPKSEGKTAHFYTVVSRDTVDAEFAQNRQRFLAEQGYAYRIVDADDLLRPL